jgi:hypothetical protein
VGEDVGADSHQGTRAAEDCGKEASGHGQQDCTTQAIDGCCESIPAATSCQEGQVEKWQVQEVKIGPSRCVLYSFFCQSASMCTAPSVDDHAAAHVAVVHVGCCLLTSVSALCASARSLPRNQYFETFSTDPKSKTASHAQPNDCPGGDRTPCRQRCQTSTTVSAVTSPRLVPHALRGMNAARRSTDDTRAALAQCPSAGRC